jgi:hypothetical protein
VETQERFASVGPSRIRYVDSECGTDRPHRFYTQHGVPRATGHAASRRERMSSASHGAACGVVLGAVVVLLLQQEAYLDLSNLVTAVIDLVIGIIAGACVFGVVGGIIGMFAGKRPTPADAPSAGPGSN